MEDYSIDILNRPGPARAVLKIESRPSPSWAPRRAEGLLTTPFRAAFRGPPEKTRLLPARGHSSMSSAVHPESSKSTWTIPPARSCTSLPRKPRARPNRYLRRIRDLAQVRGKRSHSTVELRGRTPHARQPDQIGLDCHGPTILRTLIVHGADPSASKPSPSSVGETEDTIEDRFTSRTYPAGVPQKDPARAAWAARRAFDTWRPPPNGKATRDPGGLSSESDSWRSRR